MGNVAIRVEGLGKEYRIGAAQNGFRTFRETLMGAFAAPFQRARNLLRGQAYGAADLSESLWALKDVSFDVQHGEVIGIIGRNGAGKSTLLKVLSRITEPTEGYVDVYGRVGSLLEVGTGFHSELTGRENIYLNGAILGMSRQEIDRKFDEIVDFAGVERFIDTPVKHYSSGMRLRLGFSVAAHLEPEILVVDEVLAVGDAQFQEKCLGKMSDVAVEGRTVLFVSHNLAAVRTLCPRGILLDNGNCTFDGPVGDALGKYQQLQHGPEQEHSSEPFVFVDFYVNDSSEYAIDFTEPLLLDFSLIVREPISAFQLKVQLFNSERLRMLHVEITENDFRQLTELGRYRLSLQLPALWLSPGSYMLDLQFRPSGNPGLKHKYHFNQLIDSMAREKTPLWNPILFPDCVWELVE